jgi:hypothetical protein
MTTTNRGRLTDEVARIAKDVLGHEISLRELRLMPYIQYTMMNEQRLDPRKINDEERKILSVWRDRGYIEGGAAGLSITKEFWDAINEILFYSYVDIWE